MTHDEMKRLEKYLEDESLTIFYKDCGSTYLMPIAVERDYLDSYLPTRQSAVRFSCGKRLVVHWISLSDFVFTRKVLPDEPKGPTEGQSMVQAILAVATAIADFTKYNRESDR